MAFDYQFPFVVMTNHSIVSPVCQPADNLGIFPQSESMHGVFLFDVQYLGQSLLISTYHKKLAFAD